MPTTALPGSESYNYSAPVVHIPGRAGLDVDLALFYNSRVWTFFGTNNSKAAFNADRDFPSYGFRLGFGYLEMAGNLTAGTDIAIVTLPDSSKESLSDTVGDGVGYDSTDGTVMHYNASSHILYYKNGTQVQYQVFPGTGNSMLFRPTKITDTNGNFISITYTTWSTGQEIATITDTVGRVLTFNYDSSHRLTSITQGTKTWMSFTWTTLTFRWIFNGITVATSDAPASGSAINVLTGCTYPDGTGYIFQYVNQGSGYADWGIVNVVERVSNSVPAQLRSSVSYNFPSGTTALSGPPTYTLQTVYDGINVNGYTWTYSETKSSSGTVTSTKVIDPTGAYTVTNLDPTAGWVTSTVNYDAGGRTVRSTGFTWTAVVGGNQIQSVTATNDTGQQSEVKYGYNSNGLVSDIWEYDFGLAIKRHTVLNYLNSSAYTNLHIMDRISQKFVKDAADAVVARTDYTYDSTTLDSSHTGATNHIDSSYGGAFVTRGNVTSITRYGNASAATGAISRTLNYDILGNVVSAQVDCCTQKTWSFSASTQFAYPDTIVRGPTGLQLSNGATYDISTGNALTMTDENGQITRYAFDTENRQTSITRPDNTQTTFTYDDSSSLASITKSTSANALVEKTTLDGFGHRVELDRSNGSTLVSTTKWTYDGLGRPATATNPYLSTSEPTYGVTTYAYDSLGRLTAVTPPTGGNYSYSYSGNSVLTTDPAGKQRTTFSDALGRVIQVVEPGWGDATAATTSSTISGTEGVTCVINPNTGSCFSNGYIYDQGWVKLTVNGSSKQVSYGKGSTAATVASALVTAINGDSTFPATAALSGSTISLTTRATGSSANSTTFSVTSASTDTTGNFGPDGSFYGSPASGGFANAHDACPAGGPSFSCPINTTYTYNVLNLLTNASVAAMGPVSGVNYPGQPRTYNYDSIGRTTSSTVPESGTTTISYLTVGGAVCSTDPSLPCTRTDARGIVATYSYDALNRATAVTYSDGTVAESYGYGTNSGANNNGRLTSMSNGNNSRAYTYDLLGRLTNIASVIDSTTYNVGYGYNPADEITQINYPSGRIITQGYDAVGRLTSISSGGTNYVSGVTYDAADQALTVSYGNTVSGVLAYNDHLQTASLRYYAAGNSTDLLNLAYSYGAGNNGQIQTIHAYTAPGVEDLTKGETFTYDSWWRLASAKTLDNTSWGLSWTYDRLGNRTAEAVTAGSGPSSSITFDQNTNRITQTGFSYDAAGEMTADSFNTYTWDAIGRLAGVDSGATTYTYLASDRVKKTTNGTTTVYVYLGSRPIAEYIGGALAKEYVYKGSNLVASLTSASVVYSYTDHLSIRAQANSIGQSLRSYGHFPYGETWYETLSNGGTFDKWKFTTYERDTESGLDFALHRYYSSAAGRFLSADPVKGIVSNPQSMNRYAYVGNEPENRTDPEGLEWPAACWACHQACEIQYNTCLVTAELTSMFDVLNTALGSDIDSSSTTDVGREVIKRQCATNRMACHTMDCANACQTSGNPPLPPDIPDSFSSPLSFTFDPWSFGLGFDYGANTFTEFSWSGVDIRPLLDSRCN